MNVTIGLFLFRFVIVVSWVLLLLFFYVWIFFHEHSQFTEQQGKREDISLTPFYHFHPLHRYLGISRANTAERSRLYIASSRKPLVFERKSLTTKLRACFLSVSAFFFSCWFTYFFVSNFCIWFCLFAFLFVCLFVWFFWSFLCFTFCCLFFICLPSLASALCFLSFNCNMFTVCFILIDILDNNNFNIDPVSQFVWSVISSLPGYCCKILPQWQISFIIFTLSIFYWISSIISCWLILQSKTYTGVLDRCLSLSLSIDLVIVITGTWVKCNKGSLN